MLTPLLRVVAQGKTAQFHFRQEQTCLMMKIFFRMFSEMGIAQGSQKYFCFQNLSMLKPLLHIVAQGKTTKLHFWQRQTCLIKNFFSGCFLSWVLLKEHKNIFVFKIC